MQVFTDYISPLVTWISDHPNLALVVTFLMSFTESLAVIGSIIPGSVTMTAIGILAGSGIMRLDLTYLAAILGAIAGDSFSYFLGYYYKESLENVWPFKRYPRLLIYGQEYFNQHGGKSVLIGRFIGPLRSIIPVIAGMMSMSHWRFLVANVLSAIGWSILYVTPGVLIGAASTGLTPEKASRLCLYIILALAAIWTASMFIRWFIIRVSYYIKIKLHRFWKHRVQQDSGFGLFRYLTPKTEKYHSWTAFLFFIMILSIISLGALIFLQNSTEIVMDLNAAVYFFLQSIHVPILDVFCIICSQFIDYLPLLALFILMVWWCYREKIYHGIAYLLSLLLSNLLFIALFTFFLKSNNELNLTKPMDLATNLLFATSLYTFSIGFVRRAHYLLRYTLLTMLIFAGIAVLYLGENWLSEVGIAYLAGFILGILHWLILRINTPKPKAIPTPMIILILSASIIVSLLLNFKTTLASQRPYLQKNIITANSWWHQEKPLLPLYRNNRIGKPVNLLNFQYAGSLGILKNALSKQGWKTHSDSFFNTLISRSSGNLEAKTIPLLPQLFDNRRPVLIMTYFNNNPEFVLVLRIWQSYYYLYDLNHPVWIGSLNQEFRKSKKKTYQVKNPWDYAMPALKEFKIKQISVPKTSLEPSSLVTVPPYLFLIKPP